MPSNAPNRLCNHFRPWLALALTMLLTGLAYAAPPPTPAGGAQTIVPEGAIVIRGTLEAAMDYPRVQVQLKRDSKVVTGASTAMGSLRGAKDINDLDKALGGDPAAGGPPDDSFTAFLDTGASAYVISKSTADRFKIEPLPNAVYHEAGLHGDTAMGVSAPYALWIAGLGKPSGPQESYVPVQTNAVFQLSTVVSDPLIEMVTGEVNVIGMPAIRKYLVEINPGSTGAAEAQVSKDLANLDLSDLTKPGVLDKLEDMETGPTVRLHDAAVDRPGPVDVVIPLDYISFSRRHNPEDHGPLPELADNPTVRGVRTESHKHTHTGVWLLDTGAPASMISTQQAIDLGLFDKTGQPARDPDYYLPMGGINGKVDSVPGFRIAHLVIPAANGKYLDYRGVSVFVSDISTTLDDGRTITLDGILGTNLWFSTVAGIESGFPTESAPSPYETIWIDGPGKRLMLKFQTKQ